MNPYSFITTETKEDILYRALRPDKRNALNTDLILQIGQPSLWCW